MLPEVIYKSYYLDISAAASFFLAFVWQNSLKEQG